MRTRYRRAVRRGRWSRWMTSCRFSSQDVPAQQPPDPILLVGQRRPPHAERARGGRLILLGDEARVEDARATWGARGARETAAASGERRSGARGTARWRPRPGPRRRRSAAPGGVGARSRSPGCAPPPAARRRATRPESPPATTRRSTGERRPRAPASPDRPPPAPRRRRRRPSPGDRGSTVPCSRAPGMEVAQPRLLWLDRHPRPTPPPAPPSAGKTQASA